MSIHDQYQLDSYDNDIIALPNESNMSDISENPNDLDIESNSSSPEQSTSQNNGITVITNSLVQTTNEDGNEDTCGQEYELSTGTGNLKSHLRQVHRILPPETNNKNNQLLADDLKQSVNRQERQNSLKILEALLSTEEWNSLDELAKLLHPFAQATGYIRGNQYPTLGMMIPTLIKLSRHLRDFYPTITSITVKAYGLNRHLIVL
ncbi:18885_t:CDS:2 [Racocetra fulgida]|uniref:18885_t:CDS:1 n=1 Tax=Racocetra fulgida TaxID=60492 RepID=A0A9N9B838_9GLOM|nr:18885_t:CDS:2 [Racocetra fulgida]